MPNQAGRTYDALCEITDDLDKWLKKLDIVDDAGTRLALLGLHTSITRLAFAMRHLAIDLMDDEAAAAHADAIARR